MWSVLCILVNFLQHRTHYIFMDTELTEYIKWMKITRALKIDYNLHTHTQTHIVKVWEFKSVMNVKYKWKWKEKYNKTPSRIWAEDTTFYRTSFDCLGNRAINLCLMVLQLSTSFAQNTKQ